MKKKICTLASMALVLSGCATSTETVTETASPEETTVSEEVAAFTPGTYEGSAMGFHDEVNVKVTLDETSIVSVEVTEHAETRFISDNAIDQIPQDMVDNQSINVDSYTGCTISSMAVKLAVKDALKDAGDISVFENKVEAAAPVNETLSTDVVVIGGGVAGLASAITARENGAEVVLVEKLDRVGGSSVESGGIFYATGSPVNKDLDDDVDALVDYWQMRAEGNADEDMLRIAAEGSAVSVEKMQEWGVIFSDTVSATGTSDALRGLYASNAEADGAATDGVDFVVPLLNKAEELGVTIITSTAATSLLTEDGTVTGITTEGEGGNYTINAKSVVIATGGYDLDADMMKEHSPEMAGTFALSSAGNKGDGIKLAETVGAKTNYTGGVIGFKMIDISTHYIERSNMLAWLGLLGVTNDGVRFGNEAADYPVFCTELIQAKEAGAEKFYFILDSSIEDFTGLAELAVGSNLGVKADTLEELAEAAGITSDALVETVNTYNEHALAGEADEYGKEGLIPVATAPFYAVEVQPATLGTIGGLMISENAEVLDENDQPIAGLYAAGEVANSQFLYKEYPASGTSISISTTFGRIAGESAAKNAAE